ncbi:hypothetical protein D3C77_565610 [compost metagenome]
MLEYAVAAVIGGHTKHVTHLQIQGALIALVCIGAISVACVRWGVATRTGENVLAVFITAVHQAVELLFELSQLLGIGFTVGIGIAAVASTDRQFLDPSQHVGDGVQGRLGGTQAIAHTGDVATELIKQVALLLQLQQASSTDRIISSRAHTNIVTGLLTGLHYVGKITLIVRGAGFVKLGSRNTHGLPLLKGH